jgi:hypothetical protein
MSDSADKASPAADLDVDDVHRAVRFLRHEYDLTGSVLVRGQAMATMIADVRREERERIARQLEAYDRGAAAFVRHPAGAPLTAAEVAYGQHVAARTQQEIDQMLPHSVDLPPKEAPQEITPPPPDPNHRHFFPRDGRDPCDCGITPKQMCELLTGKQAADSVGKAPERTGE